MPRLVDAPGRTDWPGGALGSHNREVLQALDNEALETLAAEGVILSPPAP